MQGKSMDVHLIAKQLSDFPHSSFCLCVLLLSSFLGHCFLSTTLIASGVEISLMFLFQFPRVRGRGWNRGNYPGNNSNGNQVNMNPVVRPPEEEWDPEYTPKSRKYYLVSLLFHSKVDGDAHILFISC